MPPVSNKMVDRTIEYKEAPQPEFKTQKSMAAIQLKGINGSLKQIYGKKKKSMMVSEELSVLL